MFLSIFLAAPFASVTLAARIPHDGPMPARAEMYTVKDVTVSLTLLPNSTTPTSSISAHPVQSDPMVPDEELAGVYICEDIAWAGHCEHRLTKPGGSDIDCTQLSGRASSIGPDPDFVCEFYTNAYCRKLQSDGLDFITLAWPGIADLRVTEKGDLNDKLHSYVCFRLKKAS